MLIILEGPDRAGKSTFAELLRRRLGERYSQYGETVEVLHRGPPTRHPVDEYERDLWSYKPGTGQHVICDRWHLGEWIYPRIFGRPTELTRGMMWHIEWFLASRGAYLVHVSDDPQRLVRRMADEGTPPTDPRRWDVQNVWTSFNLAFRYSWLTQYASVETSTIWTQSLTRERADEVITLAHHTEFTTRRVLYPFTTYVGPVNPQLLLLGDVRGPRCDDARAPAFAPYGGTSGAYLMDSIARAYPPPYSRTHQLDRSPLHVVPHVRVGLANACDVDNWYALWQSLGGPRVVTLGENARQRVRRDIVSAGDVVSRQPVVHLPHPQWVRRFHHGRQVEYGRQLIGVNAPRDVKWWNSTRRTATAEVS